MEYVIEILHITRKGETMYILERFHIYNENKLDYQINYMYTIKSNIIFQTVIQTNTSRGHSHGVTSYICLGLVQSQVATNRPACQYTTRTVSSHIHSRFSQFITSLQIELNN
jgi:hypothetical protein